MFSTLPTEESPVAGDQPPTIELNTPVPTPTPDPTGTLIPTPDPTGTPVPTATPEPTATPATHVHSAADIYSGTTAHGDAIPNINSIARGDIQAHGRPTVNSGQSFPCSQQSDTTPLYRAVKNGDIEAVTILVELCPEHLNTESESVTRISGFGFHTRLGTPLMLAVKEQSAEIMRILVNAGADPTKSTRNYPLSPFDIAIEEGYTEIVRILTGPFN